MVFRYRGAIKIMILCFICILLSVTITANARELIKTKNKTEGENLIVTSKSDANHTSDIEFHDLCRKDKSYFDQSSNSVNLPPLPFWEKEEEKIVKTAIENESRESVSYARLVKVSEAQAKEQCNILHKDSKGRLYPCRHYQFGVAIRTRANISQIRDILWNFSVLQNCAPLVEWNRFEFKPPDLFMDAIFKFIGVGAGRYLTKARFFERSKKFDQGMALGNFEVCGPVFAGMHGDIYLYRLLNNYGIPSGESLVLFRGELWSRKWGFGENSAILHIVYKTAAQIMFDRTSRCMRDTLEKTIAEKNQNIKLNENLNGGDHDGTKQVPRPRKRLK